MRAGFLVRPGVMVMPGNVTAHEFENHVLRPPYPRERLRRLAPPLMAPNLRRHPSGVVYRGMRGFPLAGHSHPGPI